MKKIVFILSFLLIGFFSYSQCTHCFGSNATLTANPSGGSGTGYTFSWSTGETTSDIDVTAGTYSVTITDSNMCTAEATFTVNQNPQIVLVCNSMDNSSCGMPNGQATVIPSGGSGSGYTYAWSNGESTQSITGLVGGTYTVTVTDSNGCTNSCSSVVEDDIDMPTVTITCTPN